jgi:hypothetical protein
MDVKSESNTCNRDSSNCCGESFDAGSVKEEAKRKT